MLIVLIFNPISKARNNSTSSIFSKSDLPDFENLIKASGLKDIIDKCFFIYLFCSLN